MRRCRVGTARRPAQPSPLAGPHMLQIAFVDYASESDPGHYPIPANASIEGAYQGCPPATCPGDRHVIVLDNATCLLYEVGRQGRP